MNILCKLTLILLFWDTFIFVFGSQETLSSTITVDITRTKGMVNRQVLGQNLLGFGKYADYGAGIWGGRLKDEEVKNVVGLAKELRISAVRFPGGGGADNYDWKDAIGKDRKNFIFGIDEFLQVAKDIDAEPIYTISYFTGTEHDAADLVEYLNTIDDGDHPWALERTKNGHKEPYDMKYFEIGNETYAKVKPDEYAKEYLKYYDAMKKVDPNIQIGVVLNNEDWNRVVISMIKNKVDFGIIHVYPTPVWGKKLETMPMHQIFDVSLAQPETEYQPLFDQTKEFFEKYSDKEIPLAITEFNGGFAQDKPVPYRFTLGNALINSELIELFMKPKNNILMANNWNFVNEYWGMIANGFQGDSKNLYNPYYKRPNYYVFEMYAQHFGDIFLKANVKSEGYNIDKYDELKSLVKRVETGTLIKPNLLSGDWRVIDDLGVLVTRSDGVLELNFENPTNFNYYQTSQETQVEGGSYYKLSGYIRTESLIDNNGVCLEIQDGRGWNVTHSSENTDKITGTTDWQYVEAVYQALPDAKTVGVIVRRVGETGPLHGKVFVKDVELERFIPSLDTKIPYLSVNASKSSDGNKVYLMVVNKNLDDAMATTINLNNFLPANKGNAWVLNGPSVDATNEKNHDNVEVTQHEFKINSNPFEFTFEPHSLTAIEIDKGK